MALKEGEKSILSMQNADPMLFLLTTQTRME